VLGTAKKVSTDTEFAGQKDGLSQFPPNFALALVFVTRIEFAPASQDCDVTATS